jgi:gliding motility-associated-like protein
VTNFNRFFNIVSDLIFINMKLKTLLCRFMFAIMLLFSTQHTFAQCFEIESILVDACGPTEGLNEMVRFKVGSSPLNTIALSVVWPNNSWSGIVQNAATAIKVAELNAAIALEGGCGQLLEPPGGILPANSTVILVTSYTVDTSQNTFGPLSSTLYIIFQNATTTGGHFVNQGTTPPILRPLTMSFGLCTDTVVYNKTLLVDGSGNNVPANGATVNFTPEGVASYTNPGCTAPVEPFTVDAGPATLTACAGATIALNGIALGEQSVLWSAPSGSFSSSATAVSNYTIPAGAGGTTIVLTLTATNSCAQNITDTINLTVTAITTPNFATTLTLCNGATAPVLATTSPNGVTGTWLPATISNTVSGNYVFTPTVGLCASPVTLAVTITTPTVPNFATTLTLCNDATAPVLATTSPNGVIGTWLPATISNTTRGNYVFTPTIGLCATPITLVVTITTPTVPNFATTLSLCSGATAPALETTSPNGVTGTWLPATISNTTSGNYVFTPTVGLCATPITLVVTITTPTVPNFATTLSLCNGSTAPALATTSPNGVTGTWLPATISNTVSGNYVFTPTVGLCAAPVTLAVTVTTPTVPNFATTLTLCNGATAPVLATTSPNGVTGTWFPATISNTVSGNYVFTPTVGLCASPVTLAVTITTPTVPNFATTLTLCSGATAPALATTSPNGITGTWLPATISNTVSGNYVFTPTVGLCTVPVTLVVTITTPTVPNFATTLSLCNGSTAPALATTSPNGVTGTWLPATISNTTSGNYVFTPTVGLCAVPVTLAVTITTPTVPDFATTLTLCSGATAPALATTSPNGVTGTWLPATISNTVSGNYVFTPTVGLCATTVTLVVTVNTLDFTIKQGCVNDKYLIEVLPEVGSSDGDYTYIWTNGSGVDVGTNSSVFNFTEYDENSNGNLVFPVQFTVTVTKGTCQMEQTFDVANALCSVSKGISPNGDGINDTLDLKGFDVSEVSIFNRYGMEVYHFKGKYVNEWKGQHRDGTILPTGTYYYMIKTNGGTTKTGWIYINN